MNPSQNFSLATELPRRCQLPEHLYIVVDDVAFPTIGHEDGSVVTPRLGDFHAKLDFACEDVSQDHLRSYLKQKNSLSTQSCFISTFEDEEIALRAPPFCASEMIRSGIYIPHATKLIIDTTRLHAGWIDTSSARVPVWLEHGELPKVPKGVLYMTSEGVEAFDASIWICVAEVRNVLGLKPHHGERGEWLACGHITRSMVEAQVVLHAYQREQIITSQLVPRRSVSIRSISSEEQEKHLNQQIARNKASREDLRLRAVAKNQECEKAASLLRQATENRQAQKQTGRRYATESPCKFPREEKLEQRVFVQSPSEVAGTYSVGHIATRYASVRSPRLREALERNQASKSNENLNSSSCSRLPAPQNFKKELPGHFSFHEARYVTLSDDFYSMSAGESPPSLHRRDTRDRAREEDSYEQTFADPPKTSLLPVSIAFSRRAFDEDRNTLPPSERLRRARAGKKRVSFVEPDDEVNDVLISVGQASNVISALEEPNHVRVSFTLPEPPLSSEGESFSDDAPCGTNEDLHTSIDFSLEEGSAPDPQTYASQRAIGSRKEREDVLA